MSLKAFNSAFGIVEDPSVEKGRFVARINQSVFLPIHEISYPTEAYEDIFRRVCYHLGIDPNPLIADANYNNFGSYDRFIPDLKELTKGDFIKTMQVLVLARDAVQEEKYVIFIDRCVELALASATTDIGIRYKDGMFYPSGAKELDEKLIDDNLDWLKQYEKVRIQFVTALAHFKKSVVDKNARKDAITNAYSAMEALAQEVLGNTKNFDNNSNLVVEYLGLPIEYKNILHYYKQMAHEYSSRHAGDTFSHAETEGFIYLTGILMRLMLQKIV